MVTLSQFCRRHADAAAQPRYHHYPGTFLEAEGSGATACIVDVTSVTWPQDNVRDYGRITVETENFPAFLLLFSLLLRPNNSHHVLLLARTLER